MDPSYTLWHPRLRQSPDPAVSVVVNVTPGATDLMPSGPESFFAAILEDLGLDVTPQSWDVLAYRSRYHGDPDEDVPWSHQWPENWRLSIALPSDVDALPTLDGEYIETYAYTGDPRWHSDHPFDRNCLVISDFQSRKEADDARNAIAEAYSNSTTGDERESRLAFELVNIGNIFFQWQIDLGRFPESIFASGAAEARQIEDICRRHGGITTFDQRAIEWDEV